MAHYWLRILGRFFVRFGGRGIWFCYAGALAVVLLTGRLAGSTAAVLWAGGFLLGHALQMGLHIMTPAPEDDTRLRVLIRELQQSGEYPLPELAARTGLALPECEQLLSGLLELEIFTLAYYPPEKRVYVPRAGRDLAHCPRCATDLGGDGSGRCPNCRLRFSRVILEPPYRYI